MDDLFRISEEPLCVGEAMEAVTGPDRGAVAAFLGTVRNEHEGRRVLRLEYHAYPAMAVESFRQIGREVRERFGPVSIAILHRTGTLAIGVYPQPVTDWVVSAILVFSNAADPTASLPVPLPVIPFGG